MSRWLIIAWLLCLPATVVAGQAQTNEPVVQSLQAE